MPAYSLTEPAVAAFIVIPVLLVLALLFATSHAYADGGRAVPLGLVAVAASFWMGATWMVASTGVLRQWDAVPPPLALMLVAILALGLGIAFSPFGSRIVTTVPLWVLVAVQAFRFPLELAMHAMYERGIMPEQMSYSGYNFDIFTGVSALAVAWAVRTGQRRLARAWNVVGLLLLANILTIALISTPLVRYFGEDKLNIWVTYPPFVWLPSVMVLAAWTGHLLVFRSLRATSPAHSRP
jgi:hypothetical protein